MTASAGYSSGSAGSNSSSVAAGRVGRAHGLDGSFYVTGARPRLLVLGTAVSVAGRISKKVIRRAGTDEHPIVRLEGVDGRADAEGLRGLELTVELAQAPSLGDGEWWAGELEGCEVVDGQHRVGIVTGLVEFPSCEALEVRRVGSNEGSDAEAAGELLVPMVRAAIRHVDMAQRRIDIDTDFIGEVL
jgi:16S rRNA processing protein RimM